MFETVLSIDKSLSEIEITEEDDDMDQLNYLAGTKVEEVNRQAMRGTLLAHVDGGVPNIQINCRLSMKKISVTCCISLCSAAACLVI